MDINPLIRELGQAVQDGRVSRAEAVTELVDASGGYLTDLRAADLLDDYRHTEASRVEDVPVMIPAPGEGVSFVDLFSGGVDGE